jgi:hypothetical protein
MVFTALPPAVANALANCRLTVIVSELPDVWMENPLPVMVH